MWEINQRWAITQSVKESRLHSKIQRYFFVAVREGGLNILKPEDRLKEYERSVQLSSPLSLSLPEAELKQQQIIKKEKELAIKSKKTIIKSQLNKNEIRSPDLASEKGASSWLKAMPLKRYHFGLTKSEFRDGVSLRYGWDPVNMPSLCASKESFSLAHALHCPKGGYTYIRLCELVKWCLPWCPDQTSSSVVARGNLSS